MYKKLWGHREHELNVSIGDVIFRNGLTLNIWDVIFSQRGDPKITTELQNLLFYRGKILQSVYLFWTDPYHLLQPLTKKGISLGIERKKILDKKDITEQVLEVTLWSFFLSTIMGNTNQIGNIVYAFPTFEKEG
jgi:hypothetical protein